MDRMIPFLTENLANGVRLNTMSRHMYPPRRTLQEPYAWGSMVILGG